MLRITVDLLLAKLPCAVAKALVRHADVVGDENSKLVAINCRKVGGQLASIPPSIPLYTIF